MSTIIETVDVAVPVRTAYDQWTQFEEFPQFMEGVEEIRQLDATHNHWRINIGGVRREFDAEVTEQHPDERIAWRSLGGTDHAGVVTFHRLDEATTRVTLQLDTAPEGVVENLGDKLGLVKHRAKGDMSRFKEYIESRGQQTGAWRGDVPRPDQRDSAQADPLAGAAGSTGTGDLGAAIASGGVSGGYADNVGGAPVYGTDNDLGLETGNERSPYDAESSYTIEGVDLSGTDEATPVTGGESTRPRDPRINPL